VEYWQEAITGELYFKAMEAGEVFFIAIGDADGSRAVLGFASDYCIEGQKHGTSVYLRGRSARRGVGSALLARTEAHAASNGATSIEIEASLAGVPFFNANAFIEVRRGGDAPDDGAFDGVRVSHIASLSDAAVASPRRRLNLFANVV
jgi:GNAT superfamily N-acetyltransferase